MKSHLPERTFKFAVEIVKLCRLLDEKPGISRALANQLLRSGKSIGANVEEGLQVEIESCFEELLKLEAQGTSGAGEQENVNERLSGVLGRWRCCCRG